MSHAPRWPAAASVRELSRRWSDLCRSLGAPAHRVHATWHEIEHAYRSPTRRYHSFEHIGEVLAWVDAILAPAPPSASVELAVWLHDFVYDTTRDDNEAASATWAREHLPALGADPATVTAVCDLIIGTVNHVVDPRDRAATAFCDADLAILGSPPRRYERYAADVRTEYAALDDAQWITGRRAVVQRLLARRPLYHNALLQPLERSARRNMGSELARLG